MVFEEGAEGGSLRGEVRLTRIGRPPVRPGREVEGLKQGSSRAKGRGNWISQVG